MSGSYAKQIELNLEIVNAYIAMGLRENAIDELLKILQKDPNNRTSLRLLAESYEMKNRYAPAFEIYKRLDILNPSNPVVTRKLHELSLQLQ